MSAGMMPALDWPGEATPGQFGPTILVRLPAATVPNTGTSAPFSSILWPALRGLVPPTIAVPAASIRAPCRRPSEPVMPWIMTRLWPVRKMAISCSLRCRAGQFGGPAGGAVHRVHLLDHCYGRLVQDPPALGGVVPVEPDHNRAVHVLAALGEHGDRRDDPVSHR